MKNYLVVFSLIILCISCNKNDNTNSVANAAISTLSCTSSSVSSFPVAGNAFTGTLKIPYSEGNGVAYSSGSSIASTGITGLSITLQGATLNHSGGELNYTITGTPSAEGTASFLITFGGLSCITNITVSEAPLTQYGIPFMGVPDPPDAVIYQVNMRAFCSTRNFRGVIDRLDSIKALGVNVIYLMPTYPIVC